jgi:transposase InsO family protein
MYWQQRFDRVNKDLELEEKILEIREEHPNYGYRRIHAILNRDGPPVNKKKVQRLVQKLGIQVKSFSRRSKYNSYKGNVGKIAPNIINRDFSADMPHQKITSDTSEFKYFEKDKSGKIQIKKLYFTPFIDMFNGEILSYSISKQPTYPSVLKPLDKAIEITNTSNTETIFHSDQGWPYQLNQYTSRLATNDIIQSMSRKSNCLDNSPMESLFGILKQEIYYGNTFNSYNQLEKILKEYIRYYNEDRIKARLGYLSPVEYRILKTSEIANSPRGININKNTSNNT